MLEYILKIEKIMNNTKNEDSYEMIKRVYETELYRKIEKHISSNNPDKILNDYVEYFSKKNLKNICIKKGKRLFRGRIGKMIIPGAIDDCNQEFVIPYYGEMIGAAPPVFTNGGRFNRGGMSYLYLATNIETCLAEVHLQVGQECSVGEFECIEDVELIDLSSFKEDLVLKVFYDIITQPVHTEIRYKYFITQFLSDVLRRINRNGLYFKSVQSEGFNILAFNPNKFSVVKYSEKIYSANKIKYDFAEVESTINQFAKRNDEESISDLNTDKLEENERNVQYLSIWIKHEKQITS